MIHKPIIPDLNQFPEAYHAILIDSPIYDSSCSKTAKVWFIDRNSGYYLKSAPKGSLATETSMTQFFHQKKLATEILDYRSEDLDWMLSAAVAGKDCTHSTYLADPKRLCDLLAEHLRMLHDTDYLGCPITDHCINYFASAEKGYYSGNYAPYYLPESMRHLTANEAWALVENAKQHFHADTLLHGDYCLPNIILDNWKFSAFIDLGNGGVGDRHVDLYWGIWSLAYNLKTDRYRDRFLDAYGRDRVNEEMLLFVAACETFGY